MAKTKKKKKIVRAKILKPETDDRQVSFSKNTGINIKVKDSKIKKVLIRVPADIIEVIDNNYNLNGYSSRNAFIVFALQRQIMQLLSRRR